MEFKDFKDILKEDGLYVAKSFTEGTAFLVDNGMLYQVHYDNSGDINPSKNLPTITLSLVHKGYVKVLNRQSLFDDTRKNLFK